MIGIAIHKLAFIIEKAREYDAQVAPVDERSGSNPSDDGSLHILEATRDNPTREELVGAIDALNDNERTELLALAWIGRGDFNAREFSQAYKQARERKDQREADYLAGTPLLADYLEEALDQLGYSKEDLDQATG
jgi:hypothetical protein